MDLFQVYMRKDENIAFFFFFFPRTVYFNWVFIYLFIKYKILKVIHIFGMQIFLRIYTAVETINSPH